MPGTKKYDHMQLSCQIMIKSCNASCGLATLKDWRAHPIREVNEVSKRTKINFQAWKKRNKYEIYLKLYNL
jgi:hypothetical protein